MLLKCLLWRPETRPLAVDYLRTGDRTPLLAAADWHDEFGDSTLAARVRAAFTTRED